MDRRKLFGENLHLDLKISVLFVVSTLLLLVDFYHPQLAPWTKWFPGLVTTELPAKVIDRTILFFVAPILIIILVFHEKPGDFGFILGEWKIGIILTIVGIIIIAPLLWLVGHVDVTIQNYYKPLVHGLPWNTFLDLFGWEFMFRGWLLFGFARKFGPEAIWLQAVPFALAHIGKPELETLSAIFGGFLFGWVAWRTKSFVYPFLIHWFIGSFMIMVAAGYFG